jgi:hypothetical protein
VSRRSSRGLIIGAAIFLAIALVVRFFGPDLMATFVSLHGRPAGGH